MNKVDGETERIRKIVKNLLDFSKPKDANPTEAEHQCAWYRRRSRSCRT